MTGYETAKEKKRWVGNDRGRKQPRYEMTGFEMTGFETAGVGNDRVGNDRVGNDLVGNDRSPYCPTL